MGCDWLLIDGSSLIFRSYYGALRSARNAQRRDANAVGPFLERLARLIVQSRPRHIAVADDAAWRPGWRVESIPTYKSHRVAEPIPPALEPQVPIIQAILAAIGIDMVGVPEYEAEDVIATWCRTAAGTIEISSGDRDLFALVEDPRVRVLYPEKAGLAVIDEAEVTRRYDIPGRRYADFAILRGDPSDGLPGLRGVGAVTAAGMIRKHGDLAGVLRERQLSDADRAYLENAMRVVPPVADLPIDLPRGRRDSYPDDEASLRALAAQFRVGDACARLLDAVAPIRASKE